MATYYRWRKSEIGYEANLNEIASNRIFVVRPSETGAYRAGSSYTINSDGRFEINSTQSGIKNAKDLREGNYYLVTSYEIEDSDGTLDVTLSTSNGTTYLLYVYMNAGNYANGSLYTGTATATQGDFLGYISSESPDAYPQDGVSGNYWYSDRTAITVSPPSSISVSPNPPKGGSNVSVSWGAASSGGGAISNYELSKRLDGGGWTVVGTYGSSTRTASVSVPRGTETIAFRVRVKDNHGFWSNYTISTYTVDNNAAPGAPESITVPETVYGGKETEISWAAASDPDGNLSGYILERQTDGGSWSQRYKGAGLSYADTVPFGTASVCYRVKAYDVENLSSGYTTSPTRSVVNAPDVPVLTVPELAMEGQTVPVSWTAATHATGYTLERKASTDADWTQVYSGQALSFSETAGAWSWVQYRVKATGEKADSAWAVSGEIPVVSASALVISGQDGDLGTLVNDVPYSVSSDTGNQISLELRVNGALWTALEVSSGYAQSIPVIDLPTGAGTIDILATVQASTGAVSAARAWTYTKTPVITSAGLCDVVEWQDAAGAVKFPITLAEAVRIPGGKTLDQVTQFPAQICTGSYVGTGTYGKDDPTEITFPFVPDLWEITCCYANGRNVPSDGCFGYLLPWGAAEYSTVNNGASRHANYSGNTVSFYGDSARYQANETGFIYYYVGIKIS